MTSDAKHLFYPNRINCSSTDCHLMFLHVFNDFSQVLSKCKWWVKCKKVSGKLIICKNKVMVGIQCLKYVGEYKKLAGT